MNCCNFLLQADGPISFDCNKWISRIKSSDRRSFQCLICTKRLTKLGQIRDHVMSHFTDIQPYQCELCAKKFKMKSALSEHLRLYHNLKQNRTVHTGYQEQVWSYCIYLFIVLLTILKWQIKLIFDEHLWSYVRSVSAFYLQMELLHADNLSNWMQRVDSENVRTHMCKICMKTLKRKDEMLDHVWTHFSNLHRYRCESCTKSFMTQASLRFHKKKCHFVLDWIGNCLENLINSSYI